MKVYMVICLFLATVFGCLAKNNARCTVVMTDGSVKENVEIDLPKGWVEKLKIKDGNTAETLSAAEVDYFELWHSDSPDRKVMVKSVFVGEYDHKKEEMKPRSQRGWMAVVSAGDYLSYLIWFEKIILKPDKIRYTINDNSHCFLKRGSDCAVMIPVNLLVPKRTRDWLKGFLADDADLTERITEKGYFNKKNPYHQGTNYNPFFFEDIAVDYHPDK